MTTDSSSVLAEDLLAVVRAWCAAHLPGLDVEAAEQLAETVGRATSALIFETAVVRAGTHAGYEGPHVRCSCGGTARFVGYRGRWVRSFFGEAHVERAYYHCAACRTGRLPWDQAHGLTEAAFTPRLKARVASLCARLSYREAAEEVTTWTGLALAESTLETLTAEVGRRLRTAEDAQTHAWFEAGTLPPVAPVAPRVVGNRAYLCVDAAKAHVEGAWHDIKVATFARGVRKVTREADGSVRLGFDTPQETQYLAVQEEAGAFGRRVYTWTLGQGAERAEVVVLGDGAEWIWNLADTHYTDAVQILDFYHASEHVWEVARAVFGGDREEGQTWAKESCERLKEAGTQGLLASLQQLRTERQRLGLTLTGEARETLRRELRYFRGHRGRMRYPHYREQGMMIGSGPVEAGCKILVGQRLKGAGMRWSRPGSDAVLAVRTALVSGRTDKIARAAWAA
jgi:hypothetical protein